MTKEAIDADQLRVLRRLVGEQTLQADLPALTRAHFELKSQLDDMHTQSFALRARVRFSRG